MGSTGEPDRKRRHVSSISPTAVTAKKQPFFPFTEDKKLDAAVLEYQNQKLIQKLETQKAERFALENKLCQLKEKQQPYDTTLTVLNKCWEGLVDDLGSCSIRTRDSVISGQDGHDRASSPSEDAFLSRLIETGATDSCSTNCCPDQMEDDRKTPNGRTKNILCNLVGAINSLWYLKNRLHAAVMEVLPEDGSCNQKASCNLETEVKNLRLALGELHLRHKSLAWEMQCHWDTDAKNKAELKRLRGELDNTIAELEDSNRKLATLKAGRNEAKGAFFRVLNLSGKHTAGDRTRDKQKDLQDVESALKELLEEASCRLIELKALHEERIEILRKLSNLQNILKNVKYISSSQAYLLVGDQLAKSKAEVVQYQALFEKLQVEKDNIAWRERDVNMKNDLVEVFRRSSTVADSGIFDLEKEIQKHTDERILIETKLEEASREPGRKDIIAEFKALVSSFPDDMGAMQGQLSKYKEAAADVHTLRADVQSLSNVLDRKAKELETLSARCADQAAEIQKLQAVVQDLRESDLELKLILEMFRRESTDSRDVLEARDSEYKAWAHVQSLKSSLDEHSIELRVKTANEAEAISQQRLAAAEAEIADLRQKLEASKRDISRLSNVLKSKHEENEAYLSEIETISQAYDDMQNQNQHLLQQITERDDYNIKLFLEGVRARQLKDALFMDKLTREKEIQQANTSLDLFDLKAAKIEDQLKVCTDHVQKLAEERLQNSTTLENTQKKTMEARRLSLQARESLEESVLKVEKSRVDYAELRIELEKERFDKKRIEEELEIARRKASHLRAQVEGSSVVEKLQQELREYREILKCSICLDRPKEVVITKCYHLFCNPCIQRIIETRHRKCPMCAASFSPNDVKPVYI
ncbi:E3 ubiquitin-protein ligase BRE1-like 1 [Malania oleifera]|uniref:E3 ubiquitin-protein ligase BRE1-like 1 n=1 Tax=Malania oleifera TaxID=397392 RepID=UPI0025AE85E0|nr:E3 ubiquitin-protein ligase BRE1-like 1 [Malania oleifera]